MGSKNYRSEKSSKCLPMELPEFLYFNRKKGVITKSEGRVLRKYKPNTQFFYSEDSAIGLLKGQRIMIVGGSYENSLRSKVTIIYIRDCRIEETTPLPEPCVNGWVHEIENWVYYVGGQKMGVESLIQAPIFKYNQNSKFWEEFLGDDQYNKIYKSLSNYGSCVLGKSILLVGGQVQENEEILSNKKVFSIHTELCSIKFETGLQLEVNWPVIAGGSTHAILVGGTHPVTKEANKQTLYFSKKKDCIIVDSLDNINSEIVERYPPVYRQNYAFFVSYPNIVVRHRKKTVWNEFLLTSLKPRGQKKKERSYDHIDSLLVKDSEIWKYEFFPEESKTSSAPGKNIQDLEEISSKPNFDSTNLKKSFNILPDKIPSVPEVYSETFSPIIETVSTPQELKNQDYHIDQPKFNNSSMFQSSSDSSSSVSAQISESFSSSSDEADLLRIPSKFFFDLSNLFGFNKEHISGSIKDLYLFLIENLDNKDYSLQNDFFKFLSVVHLMTNCEPLSEKTKWLYVLDSNLIPNKDIISKKKLAIAICKTTRELISKSVQLID